jgi:protein farnesyltransferase/geranylgeranyltransferase type-1 subunit alpha
MSYFRAVFHRNEISHRAYLLTSEVIKINPGNYSAWFFRRVLIDELGLPLDKEISFLNSIAIKLEKNY